MKCPKCQADNPDTLKFCGECGTQLIPTEAISAPTETLEVPKEELTTGSTFAERYQIIEVLGKGGMGKVYRTLDKELKEEVALKLIKPDIISDKKTLERFSNELKLARKIIHKNVGRVYEMMEEKGTRFITMEYVPGEDLRSMIRMSKQLSVATAIDIAKQVCEGLSEAHRRGVVHRDLKPSNIMIDKEGNARIMDFGIARSVTGKGITGEGVMIGTPEYMSPEQAAAQEVDQRSDIYSLGVILYEMVTGRVPFEGETALGIAMKHKSEMPKDPKELNAQIPEDLSRVILRCLEKDKEKRYQSAGEAQSELNRIEKSILTTEKVVSKKEPKTVKIGEIKWKNIIFYGGAVILLTLIILAGILLFTGRQKVIDSIAILPFENMTKDPEMDYLSDGITESIIDKLTQLPSMKKVIARSSVFRYKEKEINPQVVGQELGVDAVLISQMDQRGDELSISVELVNTADNSRIWGNQYKQEISEIFAFQEEITNSITDNLRLKLTGEEVKRMVKRYTENTKAYQAYLKGRFFWNRRTAEGLNKAIEYFEQAIKEDANYALAYSGLADCYSLLPFYAGWIPKKAYVKARAAASEALELDSSLAEAYVSLAGVKRWYDWDWSEAEKAFKLAIKLNPNYATAHHWYYGVLRNLGRHDEAFAVLKRALELDPLSLIINTSLGDYFYLSRRYDEAIEQYQKTLGIDSEYRGVHEELGLVYLQKGMFKEAIKELQKNQGAGLVFAYVAVGQREKALKVLKELKEKDRQQRINPIILAQAHLGLGEIDKALEFLEKAYQERWPQLVTYTYMSPISPIYDKLSSDPRYKALLEKIYLQ